MKYYTFNCSILVCLFFLAITNCQYRLNKFIKNDLPMTDCVDSLDNSILPLIVDIDVYICKNFIKCLSDTNYIIIEDDNYKDYDFIKSVKNCFSQAYSTLIFTKTLKYPYLILEVRKLNSKFVLNIGIMNSPQEGSSSIYELIEADENYKIGKYLSTWKNYRKRVAKFKSHNIK